MYTIRYICNQNWLQDSEFLGSLLGVILGFLLAVIWDTWKRSRDRREEYERASRSILQETAINKRALASGITLLSQDNTAATQEREIVTQLDQISLSAGESAFLKGSLEFKNPELSLRIRDMYAGLASINYRIQARELYRATNGAMTNYHRRRPMINNELLNLMRSLATQLDELSLKL